MTGGSTLEVADIALPAIPTPVEQHRCQPYSPGGDRVVGAGDGGAGDDGAGGGGGGGGTRDLLVGETDGTQCTTPDNNPLNLWEAFGSAIGQDAVT